MQIANIYQAKDWQRIKATQSITEHILKETGLEEDEFELKVDKETSITCITRVIFLC